MFRANVFPTGQRFNDDCTNLLRFVGSMRPGLQNLSVGFSGNKILNEQTLVKYIARRHVILAWQKRGVPVKALLLLASVVWGVSSSWCILFTKIHSPTYLLTSLLSPPLPSPSLLSNKFHPFSPSTCLSIHSIIHSSIVYSVVLTPSASPEISHDTVRRTWLFITYSDERWLYQPILTTSLTVYISPYKIGRMYFFWTWEWKGDIFSMPCCRSIMLSRGLQNAFNLSMKFHPFTINSSAIHLFNQSFFHLSIQ